MAWQHWLIVHVSCSSAKVHISAWAGKSLGPAHPLPYAPPFSPAYLRHQRSLRHRLIKGVADLHTHQVRIEACRLHSGLAVAGCVQVGRWAGGQGALPCVCASAERRGGEGGGARPASPPCSSWPARWSASQTHRTRSPAQRRARHTRTPGPAHSSGKGVARCQHISGSKVACALGQILAGLGLLRATACGVGTASICSFPWLPLPLPTMLKKSAWWTPWTASSRSASSHTTTGELPPSSRVTGLIFLAASAGARLGRCGVEGFGVQTGMVAGRCRRDEKASVQTCHSAKMAGAAASRHRRGRQSAQPACHDA